MSNRPSTGPRVVVIGGGISGLAAAQSLVESGASVVVLESDRIGGKLLTSPFAGRLVDEGPDAFLAKVPWATDLAQSVGIGDSLVAPVGGSARVFTDGKLTLFPSGHLLGVPTDPDAADLAAILSSDAIARVHADLTNPGPPPPDDADESIGSFIRRRLGDEVLERLVGPLVSGINAGNVDELSLASVTPQIDAVARSTEPSIVRAAANQRAAAASSTATPMPLFLAPRGGMSRLVDALVAHLIARGVEIHTGVAARSLERLPRGRWRVIADPAGGRGVATDSTFEADAVLMAAPAAVSSMIIQDHAPMASMHLAAVQHASVAIATLSVSATSVSLPPGGSGYVVSRSSGLVLTACSWASSKWADLAPDRGDGSMVFRASAGRADDRRITELDDEALVERLVDDLGATMGFTGSAIASRITRWPSSFPQYALGHASRVAEIKTDMLEHTPTITIAGNMLHGVGIPASVHSGQVAAEQAMAGLIPR